MPATLIALSLAGLSASAQVPRGYVSVPGCEGCLVHESCVKEAAPWQVVDDSFDTNCNRELLYSNEQVYAMDSHTDDSTVFTQMNSSFVVPQLPSEAHGQTVFFWPGFKAQQPEPGYPVLQPVLQYGQRPGQTTWELQSWFVWAKHFLPISVTGPAIKVSPGDNIVSYMDFDDASKVWTVYGRNERNGEESTLQVSYGKVGKQDFKYAMHVLETVMPASGYCSQYPPDDAIEFTGVTTNRGQAMQWQTRTGKSDCHQSVTASPSGNNVKFTWDTTAAMLV